MSSEFEGLSPIVIAALKSPKSTTLEELRARFPDVATSRSSASNPSFDAELRSRMDEALFEWRRRNTLSVPDDVIKKLREEVLWEMECDGWKRVV
ncbi:hypothetical protein [Gordonia sp. X0973]|uniref:hypothetical protein n=1 Tax=Gordonia sp. X0973 TaxID=2742602 RepID=UPI000F5355CC|nr:hypothetical protein [Gordonia sp. X0973]